MRPLVESAAEMALRGKLDQFNFQSSALAWKCLSQRGEIGLSIVRGRLTHVGDWQKRFSLRHPRVVRDFGSRLLRPRMTAIGNSVILGPSCLEFRLLGVGGLGLVERLPFGIRHAVDDLARLVLGEVDAVGVRRRRDTSWTGSCGRSRQGSSGRCSARRCARADAPTSRRKAAASKSRFCSSLSSVMSSASWASVIAARCASRIA